MNMTFRALAGFIAVAIILLVALVSSWLNIRSAKSPHERRFTRSSCFVVWSSALLCLTLAVVLPRPWAFIPIFSLLIIFPVLTYRAAYRRQLIRELDRRKATQPDHHPET